MADKPSMKHLAWLSGMVVSFILVKQTTLESKPKAKQN